MIRVLDLFCGAGGAAMGFRRLGFYVVGVDIKPQPRYAGDEFYQADAMKWLADKELMSGWDLVWASPPCQGYCAMKTMINRREHPKLVDAVRDLLQGYEVSWVIENVFGAPLIDPVMLCGSHFGLQTSNGYQLRRHRYFEADFQLRNGRACTHANKTVGIYGAKARDIAQEKRHYGQPKDTRGEPVGVVMNRQYAFEAMGIDWMNMDELSEAIPPAYSEYIGKEFLRSV